jgi:hypothetical protein
MKIPNAPLPRGLLRATLLALSRGVTITAPLLPLAAGLLVPVASACFATSEWSPYADCASDSGAVA